MLSRKLSMVGVMSAVLLGTSCGSDVSLLSIQIYPADPNLAHNTSFYIAPGGAIQFQIQGWYSNRTTQTISASSGKWSSTNTSIAAVDANGFVTSAGPEGVTTIVVGVNGHRSTVILGVCDPATSVCPP